MIYCLGFKVFQVLVASSVVLDAAALSACDGLGLSRSSIGVGISTAVDDINPALPKIRSIP